MIKEIAFSVDSFSKDDTQKVVINTVGGAPRGGQSVILKLINGGLTYILIISTLIALVFIILGGFQWITSGGDKAGIDGARKKITYSLLGLAIVFLSFFIINLVGKLFGIKLLGR